MTNKIKEDTNKYLNGFKGNTYKLLNEIRKIRISKKNSIKRFNSN
jgi:hypothetical protein